MEGSASDCFARALRGLAGAKLTRPGNFRTADQAGHAVRCSYKVRLNRLSCPQKLSPFTQVQAAKHHIPPCLPEEGADIKGGTPTCCSSRQTIIACTPSSPHSTCMPEEVLISIDRHCCMLPWAGG